MSRWLKNVGTFLEQLDDKAETVATEQIVGNNEEEDENAAADNLNDILARRGLGSEDDLSRDDDEEEEEEIENDEGEAAAPAGGGEEGEDEQQEDVADAENNNNNDGWDDSGLLNVDVNTADPGSSTDDDLKAEQMATTTLPPGTSDSTSKMEKEEETTAKMSSATTLSEEVENPVEQLNPINEGAKAEVETKPPPTTNESLNSGGKGPKTDDSSGGEQKEETTSSNHPVAPVVPSTTTPKSSNSTKVKALNRPKPSPSKGKKVASSTAAPPPPPPHPSSKSLKTATAEAKEAQKEARTLRRHVVSLNAQLEAAEAELKAQRKELEVAAELMERDRKKLKQEKESTQNLHAQELSNLKAQHQQVLKEQQTKFEEQIASYKSNLAQVEDRRKQEGGNMNKELAQLEEREHEMLKQISMLEDEKSTLLSQISTLQGQQSVLGSRLESLTQASDNAMSREREAEDRLDSVLTQHARQISQRQAREAELEKTVSDLNAALVAAKSTTKGKTVVDDTGTTTPKTDNSLLAKIEALEQDLETANSHLTLERERSGALHQQLREMSRETTQEASAVHAKEVHYERQIADMSLTISKLEANLREAKNGVDSDVMRSESDQSLEDSNADQVAVLSEEVVRLRDRLANYNSESKAMKNRLQSAIERANKAEDELTVARMNGNNSAPNSMELGLSMNGLDRRRRRGTNQTSSIRSVMNLDSSGETGGRREHLGNVVDAVDSFAVTTGKYMRRNPLARAGFIFYLLLIHLWTFVLLFIHAHNFEEHSDFGAVTPHGPHALVQKSSHDLIAKTTDAGGSPP